MEYILKYVIEYVLKFVLLDKLLEKIMVSWNLCHAHLLEVGMMQTPGDHETVSIVCHVGFHVDFSSMKSSLGL